jgi:hypothetical protein
MTQHHYAQVFCDVCAISPTGYRQDVLGSEPTCASETSTDDTLRPVIVGSALSQVAVHFLVNVQPLSVICNSTLLATAPTLCSTPTILTGSRP